MMRATFLSRFLGTRCLFKSLATQSRSASATAAAEVKNEEDSANNKKEAKDSQSFAMNLFRGELQPQYVFPYPDVLSSDQKEMLNMAVDTAERMFEEQIEPTKNDEIESVTPESLEGLKNFGAFGMQVPESLGGMGLCNSQYARMTEIVGAYDLGLAIFVGAHQSIGFKAILLFGTPEQKEKYLPKLASGEHIAAFALTEPAVGSDASGIKTKAELSADGKHYIMNGSKIYISNGGIAEIFTVYAQTVNAGETNGPISAFVVERGFGGVTSGPPEKKLGIKASNTTEVFFDDVKIPVENIVGGVGGGFKVAMNVLNNGRFGMASCLSGTMKACIAKAIEHASNRSQFGNKIHTYGAIQEKIARMAMRQYITESMAYMLSASMDIGATDYQIEAAIAKVYASEAAWFCVDESIQILGGLGFMKASGLERFMRDLRIFRIFEGTNDILRLFVSLTGIQFAGKHLEKLGATGVMQKRAKRMVGMGDNVDVTKHAHPQLANSAKLASKCIDNFGGGVESLIIKYRKKIIEEQFVLKRVAESAMDIYGMIAVLSRASRSLEEGHASAEHERVMCDVICEEAYKNVNMNLEDATSRSSHAIYDRLSLISNTIIDNEGLVPHHPLKL